MGSQHVEIQSLKDTSVRLLWSRSWKILWEVVKEVLASGPCLTRRWCQTICFTSKTKRNNLLLVPRQLNLRICTHEQSATAPATIYVHSISTSDIIVHWLHRRFALIFGQRICLRQVFSVTGPQCWQCKKKQEGSKRETGGKNSLTRDKTDGGSNKWKRTGTNCHTLHSRTSSLLPVPFLF